MLALATSRCAMNPLYVQSPVQRRVPSMATAFSQASVPGIGFSYQRIAQTARRCLTRARPRGLNYAKPPRMQAERTVAEGVTGTVDKMLQSGLGVVVLKRGKARFFREGRSPMVYGGAVERCIESPAQRLSATDPVAVVDGAMQHVGYGFYNPYSMFRVRLLRHVTDDSGSCDGISGIWDIEADIYKRLHDSVRLRLALGLPNDDTNAFRVVNGEGDRLSGLTVDMYSDTLVVSSSAMWCERYRPEIESSLRKVLHSCNRIIWRMSMDRLRQDGLDEMTRDPACSVDGWAQSRHEPSTDQLETASAGTDVLMKENGISFILRNDALIEGQKTGHYTDQRDNREYIRNLVRKRATPITVLDLFCYTGGFGLHAAICGDHVKVTCVDSSESALSMARANAEINGISHRVHFEKSDISRFVRSLSGNTKYDLVIADPPKFAPTSKVLAKATRKYRSLNGEALKLVRHGGLFLTCTCSSAMSRDRAHFVDTIRQAASDAGRDVSLVQMFGAAADHPITPEVPESVYLTACLFVCYDRTQT